MTKKIESLRKRAHEAEAKVQRLKSELRAAKAEVHKLNVEILHAKEDERNAIDNACMHFGDVACTALFSSKEDDTAEYAAVSYKPKHSDGERVELSDEEAACLLEGYFAGMLAMNAVVKFYDREVLAGDEKLRDLMTTSLKDAVAKYVKQFIEPETETEPEPEPETKPESEDVEYDGD